ncbi:triose-phosphate transporter family-domain-containing protein, partial [Baffinella frigidus]
INLLLLGAYFFAWYALNVGYNITNKQVLNVFPCYATVATMQLVVAWFWLVPQWLAGIRPIPKPSKSGIDALQKIAVFNGVGHLVTVLSMGLGAVSFVHVVKAAEPVFAAVLSAIFAGSVMAAPVYASLIPVMFGVGLASAGELSFTWACFGCAMMSNLLFASRAVFSKIAMSSGDQGENMDSANTFAVVTMISTLICLPVALILEHSKVLPAWNAAIAVKGMTQTKLATTLIASGFFLYTYNEFAFKVLGLVSPVAQAVGNTVKRVVILIATSIAFANPMTPTGILGSAIAMGGVLLYSIVEQNYTKLIV